MLNAQSEYLSVTRPVYAPAPVVGEISVQKIVRAIFSPFAAILKRMRARKTLANLSQLPPHLLKDIGVDHADVAHAARGPSHLDGTAALAQIAAENRARDQKMAR